MPVIDADSHVAESVSMFELLEEEFYPRRPQAVALAKDSAYAPHNAAWVIDGKLQPKRIGKGGSILITPTFMERNKPNPCSIPSMELTDVQARLSDLDRMGIDREVVYPTLFLTCTADDVELEAALMRCYNTFMGSACAQSGSRLHFAAVVPLRDIEESIRELRRARGLGAVAVMLHGVPWDMSLRDKRLFPFYEEVQRLDIPLVVHSGPGSPTIASVFTASDLFNSSTLPVMMGCWSLITSGVLDTFPRLRVAFLETGSLWLPWLLHQARRNERGRSERGFSEQPAKDPAAYFREGRAFIACETDEDVNYLISCVGEDAVVTGSDYPHPDPSAEPHLVRDIMAREDLPTRVKEKILTENPARLYGL